MGDSGVSRRQMPLEYRDLGVLEKLDALFEAGLVQISRGAEWPTPVRYLTEGDGQPVSDIWAYQSGTEGVVFDTAEGIDADVQWLGPTAPERLGYPTQKPLGRSKGSSSHHARTTESFSTHSAAAAQRSRPLRSSPATGSASISRTWRSTS